MTITALQDGVYLEDVEDADFQSLGEIVLDDENETSGSFGKEWDFYPIAECPDSDLDLDIENGVPLENEARWCLYSKDECPECDMDFDDETVEFG